MNVTQITTQDNYAKANKQNNPSFKAAVHVKFPKNYSGCGCEMDIDALRYAIRKNVINKEGTFHYPGPNSKSYLIANGPEKKELDSVRHTYDSWLNLDNIFGKIIQNKIIKAKNAEPKNKLARFFKKIITKITFKRSEHDELAQIQKTNPIDLLKKSKTENKTETTVKQELENKIQKNEYLAKVIEIIKRDTTPELKYGE